MDASAGTKIKMLLAMQDKTMTDLAKAIGDNPANFHHKMKRDNFSEKDLIKIAAALNCKYTATFTLENGDNI